MLDDSIFTAFSEINKLLKKKYTNTTDRIFLLLIMLIIVTVPIFVFDHWVGRLVGLILVSLIFARLAFEKKLK